MAVAVAVARGSSSLLEGRECSQPGNSPHLNQSVVRTDIVRLLVSLEDLDGTHQRPALDCVQTTAEFWLRGPAVYLQSHID